MMDDSSALVVGILYPPRWYGPADGFRDEVLALEQVDPRVEVVVATYEDPHEVRTARGVDPEPGQVFEAGPVTSETIEALARVHVALAIDLPVGVTSLAPNLEWVQAVGAGTSHLQNAGLADAGIRLTSNGGSNSIGIAEFAFGRLLEAAKRFGGLADAQAERRWDPLYGSQVAGQTLGLIGYGPINRAVAVRAAAFGMRVLVLRRSRQSQPEFPVDAVYTQDALASHARTVRRSDRCGPGDRRDDRDVRRAGVRGRCAPEPSSPTWVAARSSTSSRWLRRCAPERSAQRRSTSRRSSRCRLTTRSGMPRTCASRRTVRRRRPDVPDAASSLPRQPPTVHRRRPAAQRGGAFAWLLTW